MACKTGVGVHRSLLALAVVAAPCAASAAVTISPKAPTSALQCTAGVCVPTAAAAVLNAGDLQTMLTHGDVTVTTHGTGGVEATDIKVAAPVSWAQPTTLSLIANRAVTITRLVGVHGTGGLSVTFNDGSNAGSLWFTGAGQVVFDQPSASLSINAQSYTLEFSLPALIAAVTANPAGQYALAAPIDASGHGAYTASPIVTPLTGTLEGLGNPIANLTIRVVADGSQPFFVAPFNEVGATGVLRNFSIMRLNLSVTGNDADQGTAGGVVGQVDSGGVVSGVHGSGKVKDVGAEAGGIAGNNAGLIDRSSFDGNVSGELVGGLIAFSTGVVTNSYSNGQVHPRGPDVAGGGLIAIMRGGSVGNSYSTSSVGGIANIGGLVGYLQAGSIANCYALGNLAIESRGFLGGLVGANTGSITTSYSANVFTIVGDKAHAGGSIGGPAGNAGDNVYWDVTTSGTTAADGSGSSTGYTGLTTSGLQSGLPPGFDPNVWSQNASSNNGFPYLPNFER